MERPNVHDTAAEASGMCSMSAGDALTMPMHPRIHGLSTKLSDKLINSPDYAILVKKTSIINQ
jgi:hypothetical protein